MAWSRTSSRCCRTSTGSAWLHVRLRRSLVARKQTASVPGVGWALASSSRAAFDDPVITSVSLQGWSMSRSAIWSGPNASIASSTTCSRFRMRSCGRSLRRSCRSTCRRGEVLGQHALRSRRGNSRCVGGAPSTASTRPRPQRNRRTISSTKRSQRILRTRSLSAVWRSSSRIRDTSSAPNATKSSQSRRRAGPARSTRATRSPGACSDSSRRCAASSSPPSGTCAERSR